MDRHPLHSVSGANRQMQLLANALPESFRIAYTSWRPRAVEDASTREALFYYDVEPNRARRVRGAEAAYRELLRSIDARIYHARATLGLVPAAAKFAVSNGRPFVFTCAHDFDVSLEHIPKFRRWRFRSAIGAASVITTLTEAMRADLQVRYPQVEVLHIPSGHPIPEPPFVKSDPPIVLWLGRLNAAWKRPRVFLRLAQQLLAVPARFVMIGPGTPLGVGGVSGAAEPFAEAARKLPNFEFIPGVLPGEDNPWIARAALLVNTSSHEGFPNTFVQSWLRETPVASLDVDPDQVVERQNLGSNANGDFERLTSQVRALIEDPSSRTQIGHRARAHAVANHNIVDTAGSYARLYSPLIG